MEAEHIELILTGIGLLVIWVSSLIGFWIKVNVKLKELDMKCDTNTVDLDKHISWGEKEQVKNQEQFRTLIQENKNDHKDLVNKLDNLIEKFGDLRVYIESKH